MKCNCGLSPCKEILSITVVCPLVWRLEAVRLLLRYEGSANTDDSRGCFPLHLAAWNGHADICRVLLTHGPSIAKVNEQNAISETALHCAAQYGHDRVVSVLLEYHANPNIRNHHNESPLDLACQYGRLETAQQLLRRHPTLPCHNIDKHSPLHLAARNGHRQVAQLLLDAGFDINTRVSVKPPPYVGF
ncbi:hypothetical protein NP493_281g02023 [Ridgeia piscesae]|uniref:Uncharacterized protein n=1 Tax=Ridgeia piscesae TaxID=27915 RepID=A0AAD9NX87_RIDPI|nr:hypothetical protein NP493_281g02023 [Ridgeia piscesae]